MAVRGATAGIPVGGPIYPTPRPTWTNPTNSMTSNTSYTSSVNPNSDYNKIMKNYENIYSSAGRNQPISLSRVPAYEQTGRLNEVAGKLSDMSNTGGYSEADLGNIRARGVAPIRSIYASALQNLRRQKSLQGGYSPNYGAVAAKMAREQAGIIGDRTSALEADIADRVQQGKQFALSNLSPIAQRESELTHDVKRENAAGQNRVNEFNATGRQNSIAQQLAATGGMTNLYGTTPAQTQKFSQQVMSSPSVGYSTPMTSYIPPNDYRLNARAISGYRG